MKKQIVECFGTCVLIISVIGSGIMGQNMTNNNGVILLAHALTVGLTLFVLINSFAKYSGAHFNPAVTIAFFILKKIKANEAIKYIFAQIVGALFAVIIVNTMHGKELIELSSNVRSGNNIYFSEILATFGLVLVILLNIKERKEIIATCVGFYIFSAIWFTSSTCFANPAVTLGRIFTESFTGINFSTAHIFILAQILGAILAAILYTRKRK